MKIETNQNFISVDGKTVRNSYNQFFTVGEEVGHQGTTDTATILEFIPNKEKNEIEVITSKGTCHLDFLEKLQPEFYLIKLTKLRKVYDSDIPNRFIPSEDEEVFKQLKKSFEKPIEDKNFIENRFLVKKVLSDNTFQTQCCTFQWEIID